MIKTQYQVPEVYYKESRDFQLLGRIYDVIFNYLKTSINSIYNNPLGQSSDDKLLELAARTLGFESKHNYDINHLKSICSSFSKILKIKGTKKSIELIVDCLLNAQGINQKGDIRTSKENPYNLEIFIPSALADTTILKDMLEYVIPAGMTYSLVSSSNIYIDNNNAVVTETKAGQNTKKTTIVTSGWEDSGDYHTINYIDKYKSIEDYGNIIEPGTIDNITVITEE